MPMRYQLLGRSGLRVAELCLGTMTFGEEWGWGSTQDESRAIYDAYREAGGNFIDTANLYTNGTSEAMLGSFMNGHRDEIVLATKYTNSPPGTDVNAGGNHRKNMMQACEASLKRLQTDYIDLYWLHIWDQMTPVEEVMRAFDDLVRQGKVHYVGVSDAPAWWVSQANMLAQLRGWSPFIALQIEYSLIERTVERELLPMARELGLTTTAWSPLGMGVLTGKYTNVDGTPKKTPDGKGRFEHEMMAGFDNSDPRRHQIARVVMEIARETERSAAQVALAWIRRQSGVIPIIGARRLSQLTDNLACLDLDLSDDQMTRLDEVSAVDLGFPQTFYASELIRTFVYGGMRDLIDA